MDFIRPARFDQPIDRGLHDDVSQVKWIEDAGVEDGNRWLKRHSAATRLTEISEIRPLRKFVYFNPIHPHPSAPRAGGIRSRVRLQSGSLGRFPVSPAAHLRQGNSLVLAIACALC